MMFHWAWCGECFYRLNADPPPRGSADSLAWPVRQPVNIAKTMNAMQVKGEPLILFMIIMFLA